MTESATLGAYLAACRQACGLSADEISARTRIGLRMVRALEEDRVADLPASVYVRGFIRAYCEHVDAVPERALELYEAARRELPPAPPPLVAPPAPPTVRRRPLVVGAVCVVSTVVALGVVLYQVGVVSTPRAASLTWRPAGTVQTSPPLASPPPDAPAPPPPEALPAPDGAPGPVPAPAARVLVMRADDTTWVRVQSDDARATEATLPPGSVREWRSAGRFTVTLGNAGGVRLELDGKPLPALGTRGEVVRDVVIPTNPVESAAEPGS